MTSKRARAASRSSTLQNTIFGPPPILEYESCADYERLLDRLKADLKPTDIIAEGYVHDFAYWTWELLRWRRMRICLIDAKWFNAFRWASILPPTQRLAYVGKTDKIDIKSVIKSLNAPMSEEDKKKWEAHHAEHIEMFGEEDTDEVSEAKAEFTSSRDAATTRVFLEEFDNVERIDKMIVAAERRRDVAYRELERHQASVASRWRENIRNIDEAEFEVIKPEKLRINGRKSAA